MLSKFFKFPPKSMELASTIPVGIYAALACEQQRFDAEVVHTYRQEQQERAALKTKGYGGLASNVVRFNTIIANDLKKVIQLCNDVIKTSQWDLVKSVVLEAGASVLANYLTERGNSNESSATNPISAIAIGAFQLFNATEQGSMRTLARHVKTWVGETGVECFIRAIRTQLGYRLALFLPQVVNCKAGLDQLARFLVAELTLCMMETPFPAESGTLDASVAMVRAGRLVDDVFYALYSNRRTWGASLTLEARGLSQWTYTLLDKHNQSVTLIGRIKGLKKWALIEALVSSPVLLPDGQLMVREGGFNTQHNGLACYPPLRLPLKIEAEAAGYIEYSRQDEKQEGFITRMADAVCSATTQSQQQSDSLRLLF